MLASVFVRMERVILRGTPGCRVFEKPLREDNLTSHFRSFPAAAAAITFLALLGLLPSSGTTVVPGEAVYIKYCAACHDQTNLRVPHRDVLKQMTAARILRTLDFGLMMSIAYPMSRSEREAVAHYLGRPGPEPGLPAGAFCSDRGFPTRKTRGNWNGWSPTEENTRFQTAEQARLTINQVPQLKLKWAFGFSGDVTAFAATGRLLWKRKVDSHDATRLTGSSVEQNGIVFVPTASWEETRSGRPDYVCCTFRGSVTALRVKDGSVVWKSYLVDPPKRKVILAGGSKICGPSGAGIWSAPTVDGKRGLLYVGTGNNYSPPATKTSDAIVALQITTGRIQWIQQTTSGDAAHQECDEAKANCPPDYDYGASPVLVHVSGRDLVIAGQKSGIVYALDPDQNGRVLWQTRVGKGTALGGVEWGMASDERRVYAAVDDSLRKHGGGGGAIGGAEFDPVEGGGLTALRLEDGAKEWLAPSQPCAPPRPGCSPAQPGAVTAIPGIVFSGAMDGHFVRRWQASLGFRYGPRI
jgi:PQQ-like domain